VVQYPKRIILGVFLLRKRVTIGAIVVLISVILSVICLVILPDRVTVNISLKGEASYMSKYIAIVFPLALCIVTSWIYVSYYSIFNKNVDSAETVKTKKKETEEIKEKEKESIDLSQCETLEYDLKDGMKYLVFSVVGVLLTLWILFKNI